MCCYRLSTSIHNHYLILLCASGLDAKYMKKRHVLDHGWNAMSSVTVEINRFVVLLMVVVKGSVLRLVDISFPHAVILTKRRLVGFLIGTRVDSLFVPQLQVTTASVFIYDFIFYIKYKIFMFYTLHFVLR